MVMLKLNCFLLLELVILVVFTSSFESPEGYPYLPDFHEDVSVTVLSKHETCVRIAVSGNWVHLDYTATQKNDEGEDEEFDTSQSKEKPFIIAVDDNVQLPGLTEGLKQICLGEKREITIQAGSPLMTVDSRSVLKQPQEDRDVVYIVAVRSIQDGKPVNLFDKMDLDSDAKISRDEVRTFYAEFDSPGQPTDEIVDTLFKHQDKDEDDFITFQEYQGPKHFHDEF